MPRGAAHRLIGTMAHPLNRPRFDRLAGRVVEGYGVVQPRITPSLPTDGEGSCFQETFSGPSGIDPYASAVSDVYQDLFREGSYTGKGIYEIDAFEAALADKVPDNAMLSHDLFEGLFARAALATDIELFEAFPSHYEAAAARQHRWARGDWQLLPWILGRGHAGSEPRRAVVIPAIGRWKILDNLRRTLSAPAAFLTLIVGWLLPAGSPWVWSGFILATIAIPSLLSFVLGLYPRRRGISLRSHIRGAIADLKLAATQIALTVTFLRVPDLAHVGRNPSYPRSSRHHADSVVGVGDRGTGRGCLHIQPGRDVSAHGEAASFSPSWLLAGLQCLGGTSPGLPRPRSSCSGWPLPPLRAGSACLRGSPGPGRSRRPMPGRSG